MSDDMHQPGTPMPAHHSYATMRRARLGENCVYLMNDLGDIFVVSMEYNGQPVVEAFHFNARDWPLEIVAEDKRIRASIEE